MKNFKNMLKQAQEMQQKMLEAQEKLKTLEVEGSAGGGMVKVTADGKGHIHKISLDPNLLNPEDHEMLEDLIVAACNDAKRKSDALAEETMGAITNGLHLPSDFKLPF
mgnify:CR=1 FL=1